MSPIHTDSERGARFAGACAWVLAGLYAIVALAAMWRAPRVPYADGWRFLGKFATLSPLHAILAPDNGHHEVLPNAIRLLEFRLFEAQQWLQLATGIALIAATLCAAWVWLRSESPAPRRAAVALALALGFLWLGSVRTLGHAHESVHAYLVTLCLAMAVAVLPRGDRAAQGVASDARASATGAIGATLLAAVAAFSFGSGMAVFAGLCVVAFVKRASMATYLLLGIGALGTFLLRRLGNEGAEAFAVAWAPVVQAELAMRWLAAPFVYAAWPAMDPVLAAAVPTTPLRAVATGLANGYETWFGPVMLARWPHLALAAGGIAALVTITWRARGVASRITLLGLGLAWFALGVATLVGVGRMAYFQVHPEQLLAQRYLVWSSLFWAGLGLAVIGRTRSPARVTWITVMAAIALLPSQAWMWRQGDAIRGVADRTALAVAVGVLDPALETGDGIPAEIARATPAIRQARSAVFAWPETRLQGDRIESGSATTLNVRDLRVLPVANLFGKPGREVRFRTDTDAPRLLLLDPGNVVQGIAIRDAETGGWLGWMRGAHGEAVSVAAIPRR